MNKEHYILNYYFDALELLKTEQQEALQHGGYPEAAYFSAAIGETYAEFRHIEKFFHKAPQNWYALKPNTPSTYLQDKLTALLTQNGIQSFFLEFKVYYWKGHDNHEITILEIRVEEDSIRLIMKVFPTSWTEKYYMQSLQKIGWVRTSTSFEIKEKISAIRSGKVMQIIARTTMEVINDYGHRLEARIIVN